MRRTRSTKAIELRNGWSPPKAVNRCGGRFQDALSTCLIGQAAWTSSGRIGRQLTGTQAVQHTAGQSEAAQAAKTTTLYDLCQFAVSSFQRQDISTEVHGRNHNVADEDLHLSSHQSLITLSRHTQNHDQHQQHEHLG